jgi:hypothetical protein
MNSTATGTACQAVTQGPNRNRAQVGIPATVNPLGADAAVGTITGVATFTADDKVQLTWTGSISLDTDETVTLTLVRGGIGGVTVATWTVSDAVAAQTLVSPVTLTYDDAPGLVSNLTYAFVGAAA